MHGNSFWKSFWGDESGFVLSSEAVLVGTVGILGASVGLAAIGKSVNDELTELAFAFRSLDQSYSIPGTKGCCAWTAGSEYIQPDVDESLADLGAEVEKLRKSHDETARESDEDKAAARKREEAKRREEQKDREEMKRREEQKKKEAERKKREEDRRKKSETSLTA